MVLFLGELSHAEGPVFGQKLVLGAGLPSETVQPQLLLPLRAHEDSTRSACELAHRLEFHFAGIQVLVSTGVVLNALMTS